MRRKETYEGDREEEREGKVGKILNINGMGWDKEVLIDCGE